MMKRRGFLAALGLGAAVPAVAVADQPNVRWEYRVVSVENGYRTAAIEQAINAKAEEGWEVVTMSHWYGVAHILFRRAA